MALWYSFRLPLKETHQGRPVECLGLPDSSASPRHSPANRKTFCHALQRRNKSYVLNFRIRSVV